jgi:hypothetical protein
MNPQTGAGIPVPGSFQPVICAKALGQVRLSPWPRLHMVIAFWIRHQRVEIETLRNQAKFITPLIYAHLAFSMKEISDIATLPLLN